MTLKVAYCAGHGGFGVTAGKRTPDNEYEWDFNNKVVLAFEKEIEKYEDVEIKRFDDRTGRTDIPLSNRTNGARSWKADVYISIHHNALNGRWGTHTGVETYRGECVNSIRLSHILQNKLVEAYEIRDRGVKVANFHITRENNRNNIPSALLEGGFMDSTIDIIKLRDDKVLEKAGKLIAQGVAEYGNLKPKQLKTIPVDYHVVQVGDTLWSISQRYGMTVKEIENLNDGIVANALTVGSKVRIHPKETKATTPTNKSQPTPTPVKSQAPNAYTVKSGDSLSAIAARYGLKVDDIVRWNNISNPNLIRVGQVLKLNGNTTNTVTTQPTPQPVANNTPNPTNNKQYVLNRDVAGYTTAANAKNRVNRVTTVRKGTYFIFNQSQGMINVTTRQGVAGTWINPSDNSSVNTNVDFRVGQTVRIKQSARTYATGQNIPNSVKGRSFTIQQINNDRVLLREIVSWVRKTDVE